MRSNKDEDDAVVVVVVVVVVVCVVDVTFPAPPPRPFTSTMRRNERSTCTRTRGFLVRTTASQDEEGNPGGLFATALLLLPLLLTLLMLAFATPADTVGRVAGAEVVDEVPIADAIETPPTWAGFAPEPPLEPPPVLAPVVPPAPVALLPRSTMNASEASSSRANATAPPTHGPHTRVVMSCSNLTCSSAER
jgi:hypothetical protein